MLRKSKGFTLIEVLLSIFIMALIAQATTSLMSTVSNSNETISEKSVRINELQKAFSILEKDMTQMVPRHTRFSGTPSKSVLISGEGMYSSEGTGISFVRGGVLNPGAILPRGEVIRVWYRLKEGKLERAVYPYPDTIVGFEPKYEDLLTDVTSFKVRYYKYGNWVESWPDRINLPLGVKVEVELKDYGKLNRVFPIAAGIR